MIIALKINGNYAEYVTKKYSEAIGIAIEAKRAENEHKMTLVKPENRRAFDVEKLETELSKLTDDRYKHTCAMMITTSTGKEILPNLIPILQSDAAHCTSFMGRSLFSLYGMDSNHIMVLLSLMIIADNEKESTWDLFFFCKKIY